MDGRLYACIHASIRDIIKELALALEGEEDTCTTAVNDRFVSNPNCNVISPTTTVDLLFGRV